jgi:hypothetical protein
MSRHRASRVFNGFHRLARATRDTLATWASPCGPGLDPYALGMAYFVVERWCSPAELREMRRDYLRQIVTTMPHRAVLFRNVLIFWQKPAIT